MYAVQTAGGWHVFSEDKYNTFDKCNFLEVDKVQKSC